MEENDFFTKSKESFNTNIFEAWATLRKHLEQVKSFHSRKSQDTCDYNAIKRYIRQLEKEVELLEKTASFVFVEEPNDIPEFCYECRDIDIKVIPWTKKIIL